MPRRRPGVQRLIDRIIDYSQRNPQLGAQYRQRNRLTSVARSVMSRTSQRRFSQTSSARVKSARQSSGSLGVTNNPNYRYITDSSKWRDSDRPVFNRRTGEQIGAYRGV